MFEIVAIVYEHPVYQPKIVVSKDRDVDVTALCVYS